MEGNCYLISPTNLTWWQAEQVRVEEGGWEKSFRGCFWITFSIHIFHESQVTKWNIGKDISVFSYSFLCCFFRRLASITTKDGIFYLADVEIIWPFRIRFREISLSITNKTHTLALWHKNQGQKLCLLECSIYLEVIFAFWKMCNNVLGKKRLWKLCDIIVGITGVMTSWSTHQMLSLSWNTLVPWS